MRREAQRSRGRQRSGSREPPLFRAIDAPVRIKLSDSIVGQIERLILEGVLKPGDALPPERQFSERLGVSRPSLREALLKMEARGFVKPLRGGGYSISDVTAPTLTDPLVHLLQQHPPAASDILELREGLEEIAAYFAALRATRADHDVLKRRLAQLELTQKKQDSLLDAEFHLAVADASHNVALIHVMRGLFNLYRSSIHRFRDRLYGQQGNYEILHDQHRAVVNAIIAGDADAAREAAHLHLRFVRASLHELGQDGVSSHKRPAARSQAAIPRRKRSK